MTKPLVSVLPQVVLTLNESPVPEYLAWPEGQKSRNAMRQLSVAFEDNLASQIDWARISELQTSVPDALSYCVDHPVMVDGCAVHILGIMHSSDHSAEHVQKAIESLAPATILLESCVDRTQARISVQLPLVEQYNGDWQRITDCQEFGGEGPPLVQLAKHGLLDGSMELAQFMVASGSISGAPELSAILASKKRGTPLHSIDILESIKTVQNQSIDACGYTVRRAGDLSEGVLRQVVDEEGIISEYLRIMYGSAIPLVQPSLLYRLIESRKRSPPFADLLLRELHKVYRSKQYWCRIFLRDLYMSCRVKRIKGQNRMLLVVGASHVFGIRDLLASNIDSNTHAALSLSCLFDNADNLCQAWRDVFKIDSFSCLVPRSIAPEAGALIAMSILANPKVLLWSNHEWQFIDTGAEEGQITVNTEQRMGQLGNCAVGNSVLDLTELLLDGKVNPYPVS